MRDGGTSVKTDDIGEARDDMLFAGGELNVKLLGGRKKWPTYDCRIRAAILLNATDNTREIGEIRG